MATSVSFEKFYNIVGNEKREAETTYHGIDPSTGKALWETPSATYKDLDDAVIAARHAFKIWSKRPLQERTKLMEDFANSLEKSKEEFSELLYKENGKPRPFADSEIEMGINTVRQHAKWSVPDKILKDTDEVKIVTQHAPIGVVGGITPWNYPFQLAILKIAPALVTGCTIILKPSPFSPYTAVKIGEIATQIFPPGVVQVLGGDDNLGPWMTKHPGIDKITFTGSTATGKRIMAAAATTLKRVNLELGGNDAAIITEDFDIGKAAQLAAIASFAHSGQICMATKRIYVHESIYDEFMLKFTAIVKSFKAGEGFLSPIQNKMQYDKAKSIFQDSQEQKYDFAVGDGKTFEDESREGFFMSSAVVAKPPDASRVVEEEAFGPIIPVMTWRDDEEVIARANDTPTGLGATVYCLDEKRAWRIASSLETGSVWVNGGMKLDPVALFGAHKQSGIGGELGPLGLTYYTNTRTVTYWKESTPKGSEADKQGAGGLFA